MVGTDVTITVLGIKGRQVRIGVTAPKRIPVHREEVFERILAGRNLESAEATKVHETID